MNLEQVLAHSPTNQSILWDLGDHNLNRLIGHTDELGLAYPILGITEISGDPGTGKSQLVWIHVSMHPVRPSSAAHQLGLTVELIRSPVEMAAVLETLEDQLAADPLVRGSVLKPPTQIKLLIIDSFAFPARLAIHHGYSDIPVRWARQLTSLVQKFKISVLLTNHVTTAPKGEDYKIIPALGPKWTRYLDRRVVLTRYFNQTKITLIKGTELGAVPSVCAKIAEQGLVISSD